MVSKLCYTLFLLFFCSHTFLYAQDNDSTDVSNEETRVLKLDNTQEILHRYEEAEMFYSQGKLDSVSKVLQPYIANPRLLRRIDKNFRAEIFRLAAMNYILADSLIIAENCIKNVLNNQPNYQIRQGDLLSFKAALDTMYISPRLSIGLRGAWVGTLLTQSKDFSALYVTGNVKPVEKYPFHYTGFSLGLAASYYVTRRMAVQTEINFANLGYTYQLDLQGINNEQTNTLYSYSMQMASVEIPVVVKYRLLRKPYFSPYILGGAFYRYLITSNKTAANLSVDYLNIMKVHNYGAIAGIGFSKSLGKRTVIEVEARYLNTFGLINNPDKRFVNNGTGNIDAFLYAAYDAIDDLRMQNVQASFTISYYLTYKAF